MGVQFSPPLPKMKVHLDIEIHIPNKDEKYGLQDYIKEAIDLLGIDEKYIKSAGAMYEDGTGGGFWMSDI